MKHQNWSSFATLRISTGLAMLWALPLAHASAVPIRLNSGLIVEMGRPNHQFFMSLHFFIAPSEFARGNFGQYNQPDFNDSIRLIPEGSSVEFSFAWSLMSPSDRIFLRNLTTGINEEYLATGVVSVSTPSITLGPLPPLEDIHFSDPPTQAVVTSPFTLSGTLHGESLHGLPTIDFEIIGSGTVTALLEDNQYSFLRGWNLLQMDYRIEAPVPEPTTWLLLGSGLLGVVARGRSTRLNGLRSSRNLRLHLA